MAEEPIDPNDNVTHLRPPVQGTRLPPPPENVKKPAPRGPVLPPAGPSFDAQLLQISASGYDKDVAMVEAAVIMAAALNANQYGPALAAAKLRAEIAGLLVQRKEIGRPGEFRGISDEDLSAQIVADLTEIGMSEDQAQRLALSALDEA